MPIINCWECDAKISDTAESCPQCGAPSQATTQTRVVSNSSSLDPELQAEMMAQAKVSLTRKRLLKMLQETVSGAVLEKFYNSKGSGKKVYGQIKWRHFVLDDHSKDKTFQTHVSKSTGNAGYGRTYVKDVNVSTTTTNYDYLKVLDMNDTQHSYRLVDCNLSKISTGQVISLGWVQKSYEPLEEGEAPPDDLDFGQTWEGEVQPSIFVSHPDTKLGAQGNWEAVGSDKFKDIFISSSIGYWHLLWLVPIIMYFLDAKISVVASGAAILTMSVVKLVRWIKGNSQLSKFKTWYRGEADKMTDIGLDKYQSASK